MSEPLAHSGGHLLAAHLQCVAAKAADFSAAFEPVTATQPWAYLAGRDKTHSATGALWVMQGLGKSHGSSGLCPALPQHATEIQ